MVKTWKWDHVGKMSESLTTFSQMWESIPIFLNSFSILGVESHGVPILQKRVFKLSPLKMVDKLLKCKYKKW
jgi:hypothetical protein